MVEIFSLLSEINMGFGCPLFPCSSLATNPQGQRGIRGDRVLWMTYEHGENSFLEDIFSETDELYSRV